MKKILMVMLCFVFSVSTSIPSVSFASASYSPNHNKFKIRHASSASHQGEKLTIAANNTEKAIPDFNEENEFEEDFETVETIADPLEAYNRPTYAFNDKVYFYLLKPVAAKYKVIVPEGGRISIAKCFSNIYAPVRLVNCSLQGNHKGAFTEFSRFVINTTIGIAGLFDPAKSLFHLEIQEENFSQTLGCFTGPGFYLTLPFLGPSSLRGSIGSAVDLLIVPTIYVLLNYSYIYTGVSVFRAINQTSLTLGEYEDLKRAALDPYISIRNAYYQHQEDLVQR